MRRSLAVLIVFCLVPTAALAAGSDLPVPVQTAQGIKYYNGGVGLDERAALPQLYPLKIVFATGSGLYLNDAEVVIRSGGEEVLRVRADNGPWLVADVPPGSYTVEASLEGRMVKSTVRVVAGKKQVTTLRWRNSDVDMGL